MLKIVKIVVGIGCLLILWGCPSSIGKLYQYELVEEIEATCIFIALDSKAEEIALLEKYNKDKKARRLSKRDSLKHAYVQAAFEQHYRYSPYYFTTNYSYRWEEVELLDKNLEPIEIDLDTREVFVCEFEKDVSFMSQGDDDREQDIVRMRIRKIGGSSDSYKTALSVEHEGVENKWTYNQLVKKMNLKLYKLRGKGKQAKS